MLTTSSIEITTEEIHENILLYPNPTAGIINIQADNILTLSIKIYTTIGQLVFSEDNLNSNSQIKLNQPSGMYMVIVKTNNSTSTSRLIIK